MAEGDVPLVPSFNGSEIEFGGNGSKMTKANSRFVFFFIWHRYFVFVLRCRFFLCEKGLACDFSYLFYILNSV